MNYSIGDHVRCISNYIVNGISTYQKTGIIVDAIVDFIITYYVKFDDCNLAMTLTEDEIMYITNPSDPGAIIRTCKWPPIIQ